MINARIETLIEARQQCRLCINSHPGEIRNGSEFSFDPRVVSHWSQWLGDLRPKLMIVGQDFGNLDYFERFSGLDDPASTTNANLYRLLIEAGLHPTPPPMHDQTSGVFLTNSLLCFKTGKGMSDSVRTSWSRTCTQTHLLPLVNLLKPRVLVALGGPSWKSVRPLFGLKSSPETIMKAAGQHWSSSEIEIFAVVHCGGLGLRNRSWKFQVEDWQRIGKFLVSNPTG